MGMVRRGREPMDDVMTRISSRLAGAQSRRGVFAGLGKLALGAAAVVVSQSLFGKVAEASAILECCTGTVCADNACPSGTKLGYTWSCGNYFCHDCFLDPKPAVGKAYTCTYSVPKTAPTPTPSPTPPPHPTHHATHKTVHKTVHHKT